MDSRWGAGDTAVDDELEVLVGAAARASLVQPVDPAVAEEHVRLMVAAHRPSRVRWRRRRAAPARARIAHRPWWPAVVTAVAAAVVAAAMTGSLPRPVQDRLASAAAAVGVHLPRHHAGRGTRVSTPLPPVDTTVVPPQPPAVVTTALPAPPSTLGPPTTAVVAPPARPSLAPPSTLPAAPTPISVVPPAPATTAGPAPTTTLPPGTTTTTRSPTGCVNPVLVSVTATLVNGTQTVAVVIHTTGTVPYMSVDVAGATGVSANLQPTADGFQGTVTATSPIVAGTSVLEIGSCGGQIRGTAVIQA
jgi:hypothetical protein